jgi:hypothetical protein
MITITREVATNLRGGRWVIPAAFIADNVPCKGAHDVRSRTRGSRPYAPVPPRAPPPDRCEVSPATSVDTGDNGPNNVLRSTLLKSGLNLECHPDICTNEAG